MWEMNIFLLLGFFSDRQNFSQMVGLREGAGQSINGGGNKQDERKGKIFSNMGDKRGIIPGDNSAEHCFVGR